MMSTLVPWEQTYINDPVHGMMEIHPLCKEVIDTPEFQRLRFIKQCGLACMVYPGALHTRFDHSLGVCYLGLRVIRKLLSMRADISDEEFLCVQLAGLCHDLGHGPFSHTWEKFIQLSDNPEKFEHEKMSIQIFDYLIINNNLIGSFERYGLNNDYRQLIKDMIIGQPGKYKNIKPPHFLFEIINNRESGLDMDKVEYLLRDAFFFGLKIKVDFERLLVGIHLYEEQIENNQKVLRIGYRDKLEWLIMEIFKERAFMHNIAYQHRVCLRVETMLIQVLLNADKSSKITVNGVRLSKCHENVEAMLHLTDHIFESILFSVGNDSNLMKSKQLCHRILNRKHYSEICYVIIGSLPNLDKNKIQQKLRIIEEQLFKKYSLTFFVSIKKLEFGQTLTNNQTGSDELDPLRNICFINKNGTLIKKNCDEQDPSLWLPKHTRCTKVYVFCETLPQNLESCRTYARQLIMEHFS